MSLLAFIITTLVYIIVRIRHLCPASDNVTEKIMQHCRIADGNIIFVQQLPSRASNPRCWILVGVNVLHSVNLRKIRPEFVETRKNIRYRDNYNSSKQDARRTYGLNYEHVWLLNEIYNSQRSTIVVANGVASWPQTCSSSSSPMVARYNFFSVVHGNGIYDMASNIFCGKHQLPGHFGISSRYAGCAHRLSCFVLIRRISSTNYPPRLYVCKQRHVIFHVRIHTWWLG